MTGISKRDNQLEWACRILMTIDVFVLVAGYISIFQAQHQLVSPLIPESTVYRILADGNNVAMKASLISGGLFATGLWFYSFKKKVPAVILFGLAVIAWIILAL